MNFDYFEKLSDLARKAQEPFQAIAELNVKTLQNLNYLTPEEFSQIRRPEEFFEKQIELGVINGHRVLDYMQKSFQIIEKAMLSTVQDVKSKTEKQKNN